MKNLLKLEKLLGKELRDLNEEELFNLLHKTIIKNIIKSPDKYSYNDCFIHNGCIELKCRRTHYTSLRIEKKKFDSLQTFKRKYYICSTPCGIYLFDLNRIKPVWVKTLNPKTTDFKNKTYISKETFDIPLTQGKDILKEILNILLKNLEITK